MGARGRRYCSGDGDSYSGGAGGANPHMFGRLTAFPALTDFLESASILPTTRELLNSRFFCCGIFDDGIAFPADFAMFARRKTDGKNVEHYVASLSTGRASLLLLSKHSINRSATDQTDKTTILFPRGRRRSWLGVRELRPILPI